MLPENTRGLVVLITIRPADVHQYTPFWVQWIQQHYSQWVVVDIDSQSDPAFLSYIQKAMAEQGRTLFLVDAMSEKEDALGRAFALLQKTARERPKETTMILHGSHRIVEKMGVAFQKFYRTSSAEETEKVLHLMLGRQ